MWKGKEGVCERGREDSEKKKEEENEREHDTKENEVGGLKFTYPGCSGTREGVMVREEVWEV
jgi:hypothetical protein